MVRSDMRLYRLILWDRRTNRIVGTPGRDAGEAIEFVAISSLVIGQGGFDVYF